MMWNGWGGYGMGWFGVMHVAWWLLLVLGAAALFRLIARPDSGPGAGDDSARRILRERYARGEIDKQDFDERMQHLKG